MKSGGGVALVKRKSFGGMPCAIAQALDIIGEWWSILIIREAFYGTRCCGDFESRLGIARSILTARLGKLTEHGIFRRVAGRDGSKYLEYELTEMGQALGPVLVSLSMWGSKWIRGKEVTAREVFAGVENLFDRTYYTYGAFTALNRLPPNFNLADPRTFSPSPPRTWLAGMQCTL